MVPILCRSVLILYIFIDLASDLRFNLVQISRCLPPCHEFYTLLALLLACLGRAYDS